MRSRRTLPLLSVLLLLLALAACTAGPNQLTGTPGLRADPAGFWLGLWHGFISFFTFVVSLFTDGVGVYEVHNSGAWYDLGFVLGIMVFYGGGGGRARTCPED